MYKMTSNFLFCIFFISPAFSSMDERPVKHFRASGSFERFALLDSITNNESPVKKIKWPAEKLVIHDPDPVTLSKAFNPSKASLEALVKNMEVSEKNMKVASALVASGMNAIKSMEMIVNQLRELQGLIDEYESCAESDKPRIEEDYQKILSQLKAL